MKKSSFKKLLAGVLCMAMLAITFGSKTAYAGGDCYFTVTWLVTSRPTGEVIQVCRLIGEVDDMQVYDRMTPIDLPAECPILAERALIASMERFGCSDGAVVPHH